MRVIMYLSSLQIVNFRNLKSIECQFSLGINTIIGENGSGKSNAMTALRILLDNTYPYSRKLKESDFYNGFENLRGEWIIISAKFSSFSESDKQNEACAVLLNDLGNSNDEGVITLYIRPNKKIRNDLYVNREDEVKREQILVSLSISDYEFSFKARSCHNFTDPSTYKQLLQLDPSNEPKNIIGDEVNAFNIREMFSIAYIDALRDAESELRKFNNPLRNIYDLIKDQLEDDDISAIESCIAELNNNLLTSQQITEVASNLNRKLSQIVGSMYGSDVNICSQLKNDIRYLGRFLSISPSSDHWPLDSMGLGELNVLFIGLKLLEYEYLNKKSVLNIMILEEPEAHVHVHIQRELFNNVPEQELYTQFLMTTHSTHLSEISKIDRMNIFQKMGNFSIVMHPSNDLTSFAKKLELPKGVNFFECIQRYLDTKRSILLFSRSVLLVEGDAEEILIPALVKKIYGVSLDELGIGLVNIGSVSFEYVAGLFGKERIQRRCAIVTDGDDFSINPKANQKAKKIAKARLVKLNRLFEHNDYVKVFSCPGTFEIELGEMLQHSEVLSKVLGFVYKSQNSKDKMKEKINNDPLNYLRLANSVGKGWLALVLSGEINSELVMPKYIENALCYAVGHGLTLKVWKKICLYIAQNRGDEELIKQISEIKSLSESSNILERFSLPTLCHQILRS